MTTPTLPTFALTFSARAATAEAAIRAVGRRFDEWLAERRPSAVQTSASLLCDDSVGQEQRYLYCVLVVAIP